MTDIKHRAKSYKQSNLLPCPFCGGEAIESYNRVDKFSYVSCKTCGVKTGDYTWKEDIPHDSAHSKSVNAWNRRVQDDIYIWPREEEDWG